MEYNTKEGIAAELTSYATFYAVMQMRNEKGYKRDGDTLTSLHGKLTPFTVLGRYHSNEYGRCARLDRALFTDSDRMTMQSVMTAEEFQTFFDQEVKARVEGHLYQLYEGTKGMAPSFPLPAPHILCARCSGTWNLNTCHDIDAEGRFEEFDLAPFAGKTLREIHVELQTFTDAERSFGGRLSINPKWTKDSSTSRTSRNKQCSLDYVAEPGDYITLSCDHFYHGPCFRELEQERMAQEEAENESSFKHMLEEAGFEDVVLTRMPFPQHLQEWAMKDADEDTEELIAEIIYYRITTRQGSFGALTHGYVWLDLTGLDISPEDIELEFADEFSDETPEFFPALVGLTGEPAQLLRFWQQMVKHQKKT